ncbi:F-box associated domain containing protein [Tanacetum coccineum]
MNSLNPTIEALPGNIMADVITRLPVKTIIYCKCVCKNWRELVYDSYFVNLHISISPAGVMIHEDCDSVSQRIRARPSVSFHHLLQTFSFFPSPPSEEKQEFTIWVKEYGIRKSWHKEVVFTQSVKRDLDWLMGEPVTGLFGLEDGTILMFIHELFLVYCSWQKTIEKRAIFGRVITGIAYRPSLFKLQTFESERVHVF